MESVKYFLSKASDPFDEVIKYFITNSYCMLQIHSPFYLKLDNRFMLVNHL